jgi:dipeptidyl aminopeptidase/acylaminoacyl peptidase
MRAAFLASLALCGAVYSLVAQAPPATDIYLAPLSMRNGKPVVGTPVNITNRAGYDNQPSFAPDNKAILFTSVREDGQSDIYRYDIGRKSIRRVTSTAESEYSATVMPGGKRFSVIRVEKDSTQRLWSFALDGSDPKLVLTALRPVGYHAWLDANNLALFVLGRPNALVLANARTDKSDTLARNIGRSLLPLPDRSGFSYIRIADSTSMLATMRWPGGETRDLVAMPRRAQDVAWAAAGVALVGSGARLLSWSTGATEWTEVVDLAPAGLTDVTRLAVSPNRKWLAIVAVPKS